MNPMYPNCGTLRPQQPRMRGLNYELYVGNKISLCGLFLPFGSKDVPSCQIAAK